MLGQDVDDDGTVRFPPKIKLARSSLRVPLRVKESMNPEDNTDLGKYGLAGVTRSEVTTVLRDRVSHSHVMSDQISLRMEGKLAVQGLILKAQTNINNSKQCSVGETVGRSICC